VCQGSKNIWEFYHIFRRKKNEVCFGAYVVEVLDIEENECSLGDFEIFQRGNDGYERDRSLG